MYSNLEFLIERALLVEQAEHASINEGSLAFLLVEGPTVKSSGETYLKQLTVLKTTIADTMPKTSKLLTTGEKKLRGAISNIDDEDYLTKAKVIGLFTLVGNFASATTQLFTSIDTTLKSGGIEGKDTLEDAVGGNTKLRALIGKGFIPSKDAAGRMQATVDKLDDSPKADGKKSSQEPKQEPNQGQDTQASGSAKLSEADGPFSKIFGAIGDKIKGMSSSSEATKELQLLFGGSITAALMADLRKISLSDYVNTVKQVQPILLKLNPAQKRLPNPVKAKSKVPSPGQNQLGDAVKTDVAVTNQVVKSLSTLDGGESIAKIIKAVIDGKSPTLDGLSDQEKKFLDGLIEKLKSDPSSLSKDTTEKLKSIAANKTGAEEGGKGEDGGAEEGKSLTDLLFQKKSKSLRSKKNLPDNAAKLRQALEDTGIIKPDDKEGNKKDILDKVKAFKDAIDGIKLESVSADQVVIERWQRLAGLR